jgi:hypothetical protein
MGRFDELIEDLRAAAKAEYGRGFADGLAAMRQRILDVASAPSQGSLADLYAPQARPELGDILPRKAAEAGLRAPRGSVGRMMVRLLSAHPDGLTATQIKGIAPKYDAEVAAKSIGNELRRFEGEKYRRDERGRWLLLSGSQMETAGSAPAVNSEEGGQP